MAAAIASVSSKNYVNLSSTPLMRADSNGLHTLAVACFAISLSLSTVIVGS
jgi:hypothetical protein